MTEKYLIISGYQGIGKSTIAGKDLCIDLESSFFHNETNWWDKYSCVAVDLASQGYTVLVSCHNKVRETIWVSTALYQNIQKAIIIPNPSLYEEWTNKLEQRYLQTKKDKDFRAWQRTKYYFKEDIAEIMDNYAPIYTIDSMDYKLSDIIAKIRNEVGRSLT